MFDFIFVACLLAFFWCRDFLSYVLIPKPFIQLMDGYMRCTYTNWIANIRVMITIIITGDTLYWWLHSSTEPIKGNILKDFCLIFHDDSSQKYSYISLSCAMMWQKQFHCLRTFSIHSILWFVNLDVQLSFCSSVWNGLNWPNKCFTSRNNDRIEMKYIIQLIHWFHEF